MSTEIKTLQELNLVVNHMMGAAANVIASNLYKLPTAETDKILTIEMTKEEFKTIYAYCICVDITEDLRVYSCGGAPFKVHITDK